MKRKVFTTALRTIEGILFMMILIAIAGLDASNFGLCVALMVASGIGLFVANKVEEALC